MAPIKFEENIREKLQERELQPGKDAWSKLESKLDTQFPEKKGNRSFWLAIAASMVGVLLVVSYFAFELNKEQPEQLVVDETELPSVENTERVQPVIQESMKEVEQEQVATSNLSEEVEEDVLDEKLMEKRPKQQRLLATETKGDVILENNAAINSEEKESIVEIPMKETAVIAKNEIEEKRPEAINEIRPEDGFMNAKVDEVVASIQQIENANNTVTAEEIDALLRKAQRDIANQRLLDSSTKKIDATALLQDVETELERSFRDKVFDALGDGYNKIRTAVAERNN
ncbi:MAG: hypothetical protein AAF466_04560 [Bacteroidota bacterium]